MLKNLNIPKKLKYSKSYMAVSCSFSIFVTEIWFNYILLTKICLLMRKLLLMCVSLLCSIAGFSETIIQFADNTAKQLCVQNWDANQDGELSQEEAAAVKDIGVIFRNKLFVSFNEFQYFTGVSVIPNQAFEDCHEMRSIVIPKNVTSIGNRAFANCQRLPSVNIPVGVITYGNQVFAWCYAMAYITSDIMDPQDATILFQSLETGIIRLYVPADTKAKYQTKKGWKEFMSIEEGEPPVVQNGDLNYLLDKNAKTAAVIAGQYDQMTSLAIPASITIDGVQYAVKEIGKGAFCGCYNLKSISMPDGIESIGAYAFRAVDLPLFEFPAQLKTIGDGAFQYSYDVKEIVIPEGVTMLGNSAFEGCRMLQKITLPASLTSIGSFVVGDCSALNSVISHSKEPVVVNDDVFGYWLWDEATRKSTLTPCAATLYVPSGSMAAYKAIKGWTMFKDIVEGKPMEATVDGLTYSYSTGSDKAILVAGAYQNLTSVGIPGTVVIDGKNYQVAIGGSAFSGCYQLKMVTIGEGVTEIGNAAFRDCNNITEVKLPNTLQTIGDYAFQNCRAMASVTLPEGLTTIGNYVFNSCQNLQKIVLPKSLTKMGSWLVQNCQALTTVVSRIETPFNIPDNAFARSQSWDQQKQAYVYTPWDATLYVPDGTKEKYQDIEGWTVFKAIEEGEVLEATVGDLNYIYSTGSKTATVTTGNYTSLTTVEIPQKVTINDVEYTVTAVAARAFYNCNRLTSVSLPEGLTAIGDYAFRNVYISELKLPSTLKTIGNYAFQSCCNLTSVVILEGVTSIGNYAFDNCQSLQKIVLPKSLTKIGYLLVRNCSALTTVVSRIETPFNIPDNAFARNSVWDEQKQTYVYEPCGATLCVPVGTKSAYEAIEGWTMFKAIEEGDVLETKVGDLNYMYYTGSKTATVITGNYTSLTKVEIPQKVTINGTEYTVTAVAARAFYNCNRMTSLSLPEGLTTIGNSAFQYCHNLTSVVIPEGVTSVGDDAFYNCEGLQKVELPSTLKSIGSNLVSYGGVTAVVSRIKEPFEIPVYTFGLYDSWDAVAQKDIYKPCSATLYVPEGTKAKYQAIEGWTMFKAIEEGEVLETTVGDLNYMYYTGSKTATVITGNYTSLAKVEIPQKVNIDGKEYAVTAIGTRTFYDCNNLTSLSLPEGLTSIGDYAFQSCYNLTSVVIPEGVTSVGNAAFYNCERLQKVELPSTLKSIGNNVIQSSGVTTVVSRIKEPFAIHVYAFGLYDRWDAVAQKDIYKPCSATLYVPEGTKAKYQAIEGWMMFAAIEEGEVGEAVVDGISYSYSSASKTATVVRGDYANLTDIVIPGKVTIENTEYQVTTIGSRAFNDFNNIRGTLTIGEGVTTIGSNAFQNIGVTKVTLPTTLKTIGDEAFEDCCGYETITIPEGVETIGRYAFSWNGNLRSIVIPSTVKSMGNHVFYWDTNLSSIISRVEAPTALNDLAFARNYSDGQQVRLYPSATAMLFVPAGTKTAYQNLAGWNQLPAIEEGEPQYAVVDGLNYLYSQNSEMAMVVRGDYNELQSVSIPATVEIGGKQRKVFAIGGGAFSGTPVTSLSIADGISYIGASAFASSAITSLVIPGSVKLVDNYAFGNIQKLTDVVVSEGVEVLVERAFAYNPQLQQLELPSSLISLGYQLVGQCPNLKSVISHIESPRSIGEGVFIQEKYVDGQWGYENCPATLYVPKGKVSAYQNTAGWNMFADIVEIPTETISVNMYGQVAYVSEKALDFNKQEALKAYVATGYDKTTGTIWLTRVKQVPANTGFLLMGEAGDHEVQVATSGTNLYYANLFESTLTGTTVAATQNGKAIYYLTTGTENGKTVIGFYRAKASGTKVGANRAYLAVPADIPAVGTAGSTEAIKVSAAGQVPYYSANSLDFTSLDEKGVKAYIATGYDYKKGTIWLTGVKKVPAETGILIVAPEGTYDVPTASVASVYGNMFAGNLEATTIYKDATVAGQDYMNYYLSKGTDGVGFYRVKDGGVSMGANRAYLQVPAQSVASARAMARGIGGVTQPASVEESEVIAIRLLGDADRSTTGIGSVERVYETDVYYNLQGQRVDNPGKGLYIRNGKKVVIR